DPTKTYTGRSYPARKYAYTVTLLNNMRISGHITSGVPIYVQWEKDKKPRRFILHNRDKGKVGMKLKDLPYVKEIRLGRKAYELAVAEARKLAKEAEAKKKAAAKGSKGKKRGAKPEKEDSNAD
ncbi:MAG: hypothetical protein QF662_02865, partial [Phycisphaerae bacterium]|nr:hypothetical protein [Phycisphaerae bacterium]